jgi:hypothetical protein
MLVVLKAFYLSYYNSTTLIHYCTCQWSDGHPGFESKKPSNVGYCSNPIDNYVDNPVNPLNESQLLDEQIVATKCRYQLTRRSVLSVWLCVTHLFCRWSIVSREHVPHFSSHGRLFCERHTDDVVTFADLVTFMVIIISQFYDKSPLYVILHWPCCGWQGKLSRGTWFETHARDSIFRTTLFGLTGPVPLQ